MKTLSRAHLGALLAFLAGVILTIFIGWGYVEKLRVDKAKLEQRNILIQRDLDWAIERGVMAEARRILCEQQRARP